MKTDEIIRSAATFRSRELALSFASRGEKNWVVQGDIDNDGRNGLYWVVTPREAEQLVRAGYEIIR